MTSDPDLSTALFVDNKSAIDVAYIIPSIMGR